MQQDSAGYHGDLEQEYRPREFLSFDREYSGLEGDYQSRQIMVETEYLIEEKFGKQQIEAGKVNMYKGTLKKW